MLTSFLGDIVNQLRFVLFAIVGMTAVVLTLFLTLLSYKKYREAMFILYPKATEDFIQWQKENGDDFDNINDSAQAYINAKNVAAKFEMMHGKEYRKNNNTLKVVWLMNTFKDKSKHTIKFAPCPYNLFIIPPLTKWATVDLMMILFLDDSKC
ncbi:MULTISPECIES: hypothetical protein [Moraxella]|uniref:Uncharacterized protein n=1 Tax=Moraxella lacunata TaxID=477 RepID=A0A1B8Q601_MORLA|nr:MULTISPECIES: hypothetical protein [Moraxella]MBE9578663.1 hypothetical protein [Moraxella sp. K1664]MBE9586996.1 hypothetical protein [Moraxella sp. K1630]MBE9595234.1 hypothetical protein [Moraxella sp. K2450]MDH9218953.1 hypothetical protein [Moraxella lacunata]MDI4482255.1 hypothetical protein [Moraxella lacunata]